MSKLTDAVKGVLITIVITFLITTALFTGVYLFAVGLINNAENMMVVLTAAYVITTVVLCYSTVATNNKSEARLQKSLNPILSFKLLIIEPYLYLCVENTGNSAAKNVKIDIEKIENNCGVDFDSKSTDQLFRGEFELYPKESVSGEICLSVSTLECVPSPKATISVKYNRGNDDEQEKYRRTVSIDNVSAAMRKIGR